MDLVQLEHFLAVASERTFTRAAERVFRTQPALSQSIKKLENDLGVPLFLRENGHVSLTEAGLRFESYASQMLKLRDDAKRSMAQMNRPHTESLSIMIHEADMQHILPPALTQFQKFFPNVRVTVGHAQAGKIINLVQERGADIGLVSVATPQADLQFHQIAADPMVLIASADHWLSRSLPLGIRDLDGAKFLLHHPHTEFEDRVLELFSRNGVRCEVAAELSNFETIKSFVEQRAGLAFVPRRSALHALQTGSLAELQVPLLEAYSSVHMVYSRTGNSPCVARFIEIMRSRRSSLLPDRAGRPGHALELTSPHGTWRVCRSKWQEAPSLSSLG